MKHTFLCVTLFGAGLMLVPSSAALADPSPARYVAPSNAQTFAPQPEANVQRDIRYLAGGVGEDARAAMQGAARDYNLHLSFAAGRDGHYVPDVHVKLRDAQGTTVFDLANAGPLLYVQLAPGRYVIEADYQGIVRSRTVTIDGVARTTFLHWPEVSA